MTNAEQALIDRLHAAVNEAVARRVCIERENTRLKRELASLTSEVAVLRQRLDQLSRA